MTFQIIVQQHLVDESRETVPIIFRQGFGKSNIELEILAQYGVSRVALSKQVLRTETAAVSLLAAVNHLFN